MKNFVAYGSPGQETPHVLLNTKIYYRFHRNTPLDSIMSHTNPVQILAPYFFKIHFNIVFC